MENERIRKDQLIKWEERQIHQIKKKNILRNAAANRNTKFLPLMMANMLVSVNHFGSWKFLWNSWDIIGTVHIFIDEQKVHNWTSSSTNLKSLFLFWLVYHSFYFIPFIPRNIQSFCNIYYKKTRLSPISVETNIVYWKRKVIKNVSFFRYLRHSPRLAQYTKCHSPNHLKGQSLLDLQEQDFKCSGNTSQFKCP